MPPTDVRRIYWDTCVVLSYIEEYEERVEVLETLLANSADASSAIEIVTSTFTIAEVAFTEAEKESLRDAAGSKERIEAFWHDQAVRLAELHEIIALGARDIVRRSMLGGWSVKPKDAVHLATAEHLAVRAFHTYDGKLLKCNGKFAFEITEPNLLLAEKLSARPTAPQAALDLRPDTEDQNEDPLAGDSNS